MTGRRSAVFVINLVQDVNVLRPLIYMATRDFGLAALLLVSTKLNGRDLFGIWRAELEGIAAETGARVVFFDDDWEAHQQLTGEGLIFAASESHLHNHVTTHSIFQHAPPTYLRVTLQHGFECVGFRHSADHIRAHGVTASFGADIVCGWYDADRLTSMAASQKAKLLVTGPTSVLQMPNGPIERFPNAPGIVCENLHSVRLNGAGDFKSEFVAVFADFCKSLEDAGSEVVLRPHPGGQYVLKNKVALPPNARINNAPMYRVDLRRYAYGISAPSSVLIDMLLAGIPTAVWRDRRGDMDADNYAGLTTVSTTDEWAKFARAAIRDPEAFLDVQTQFLAAQGMPLEPSDVYARYAQLFRMAKRVDIRPQGFVPERERILFVANANVPTLQLSFEKPFAAMVDRGEVVTRLLTEPDVRRLADEEADSWADAYLDRFDPSVIIFCRYSGPGHAEILAWARRENVPLVYHIDDDLLAIPEDIGARKHAHHNAPERIATVTGLLQSANLVYASTERLRSRLAGYAPKTSIVAGRIYCSGSVLRGPEVKVPVKVGYMASADHAHNLQMMLPAIVELLEQHDHVQFEFFGSIPVPAELQVFGDRITTAPPISDYSRFLTEFAKFGWDIGICPLVPIDFNLMKANTKWVEYTSVGAAVVASAGTVYDDCCADGCGILANSNEEWLQGLDLLVTDADVRVAMVERAQDKLRQEYNLGRLRTQVLDVIGQARQLVDGPINESKESSVCLTA